MPQYVACKFHRADRRTYTYHNDGDPVAVGDFVKVPDNRTDGWKRVEVVVVHYDKPPFATKAILGKIEPDEQSPVAA